MSIRRKAFSIGTSAALIASLFATTFAGPVFAASGTLNCTVVGGGETVPAAFGATGSSVGSYQPGTVVSCTNNATPAGVAADWSATGNGATLATTPAPSATAAKYILGTAANSSTASISFIAGDSTTATVQFTLLPLAVSFTSASQLVGVNDSANATNAIGNGVGAGAQAGVTYAAMSTGGQPTVLSGACTISGGAPATAAVVSTANTFFNDAAPGTCAAAYTYNVTATTPGTLNFTTFTVAATSSTAAWVSATTATCTPASGTLAPGDPVSCYMTLGAGASFVNWVASDFTPTADTVAGTSGSPRSFTAGAAGAASITANWSDAAGAHSMTFSYTVGAVAATCTPGSGNVQATIGTVSCYMTLPTGTFVNWTGSGFATLPNTTAGTSGVPVVFTAGATLGAASLTAHWLDASAVAHSQLFSYTIVAVLPITGGGTVTVTGALSVPRGDGYVSPTGATLTFTEGVKTDFGTGFSFIVNIAPATPGAGPVSFNTAKAITVVAPDSLGLTATFLNAQQILVTSAPGSGITNQDAIDVFSIGGLQIKAASGTTLGAIQTTISGSTGSITNSYWASSTAVATGTLNATYNHPVTSVAVTATSSCGFAITGGVNGTLNFASNPESVNVTNVSGSTLTIDATTLDHGTGTSVSQTVANCAATGAISSIGSVVDALLLTADINGVQAGLNNQAAGNVYIAEQAAAFIPSGTVCTLKIAEPGVRFSSAASVDSAGTLGVPTVANLSFDDLSLSFTTTAASTAADTITVFGIKYDVASTATLGDAVMVTVTCGALLIAPTSVENAFISNAIGQVAAAPTVFIGYNDQQSGMLSVKESQPGFFGSLGAGNTFTVCLNGTDGATFTRFPWAVVSAGDLKLLNPSSGTGVSQLAGTLSSDFLCASWSVYSASTVASTIDIRGSDATGAVLAAGPNNGPRYNIASTAAPGPVHISLAGSSTAGTTNFGTMVNAIKAFKSGVAVAAVTQPYVAPGGLNQAAGNITISESLNGQLLTGETIACHVLNSAFNRNNQVFLSTAISNDLPIVSTNTSTGLIAHLVGTSTTSNSFTLMVDQPAFAPGLGVITISNLHYTVVSDAVLGPVLVECSNIAVNVGETFVTVGAGFDAFISNAIVGTAPAAPAASGLTGIAFVTQTSLGATKFGTFSITTKVAALGKYVTWRFAGGSAIAGKIVTIWKATKNASGTWSAFTKLTSRLADSSGNAFFWWRSSSKTWVSVRAQYPGDATHFLSWSVARQARWL